VAWPAAEGAAGQVFSSDMLEGRISGWPSLDRNSNASVRLPGCH
jgi:hypothetical protein